MTKAFDKMTDKAQKRLAAAASIITSLGIIVGAVVAAINWTLSPLTEQINSIELSTTRNELMILMNEYPDNIKEIQDTANHYFIDLKGDTYIFGLYEKWAEEHKVDAKAIKDIHDLNT